MGDVSDARNQSESRAGSQFDCHICLCTASDPVVTLCGSSPGLLSLRHQRLFMSSMLQMRTPVLLGLFVHLASQAENLPSMQGLL